MKIDDAYDTKAWTAARVPVKLVQTGNQLRLLPDEQRNILARDVMLNRLHILADRAEVLKLLNIALPNVIDDVFGELPMIHLPSLQIQGVSNAPMQTFTLQPNNIVTMGDHWRIQLQLATY